jgi:signal transduction histidine kinase
MAGLMLFIGKNKLHRLWSFFCFCVFLFGLGIYFVGGALTPDVAALWWKIGHIGAILIPVVFLHFVYEFLGKEKTKVLVIFYVLAGLLLIADFTDGLFIDNMRFVFGEFYFDSPPGLFYPLYTTMFFVLTAYSHYLLWEGFKESKDRFIKDKIKFFFFGMGVSFAGGAFNFLPVYGIDIYPYMNMTVFLYPLIISYAIVKHQLFDIKLILVEMAVLLLNLFLFLNIFTSSRSIDLVLNILVFLFMIEFSFVLMRGIYKDIQDREKIEGLVAEMEVANERLRKMEEQKTEFVSIASHQLRTPLTIIKGYTSMLLEGTFGTLVPVTRGAVEKLYDSNMKLVELVEDLLTISRIEQGRGALNFETTNFKDFVQSIFAEAKSRIQAAKIDFVFDAQVPNNFFIAIDQKKFKQVVRHILENALKYTPPHGSVHVFIMNDTVGHKIRLIVSDTGAGMTSSQIEAFSKQSQHEGVRHSGMDQGIDSERSSAGTPGLGLYIAREIIEAHHGMLYLESAGVNSGVTVVVEIPQNHKASTPAV